MAAISGPLVEETVVLPATVESLVALQTTFDRFWQTLDDVSVGSPDEVWRIQLVTALMEISSNIIRHAYGKKATGSLGMRLRLYQDRVVVRLSDTGRMYSEPTVPVTWDHADLMSLPEGGMGLAIAKAALDSLSYRRTRSGVNCWLLIKRIAQQ